MNSVYKINEIKNHRIVTSNFPEGLTVILNEYVTKEGTIYKILLFNHEEGEQSEYGQYKTKDESLNDYEGIMRLYVK